METSEGPRATMKETPPLHVGLGPSHATRACERVSLAMRLAVRPRHPCRAGSPDPDPFVIRRSQTTEEETHIGTMELAGETRSDARMETSEGPRATGGEKPYGNIETRMSLLLGDIQNR